MSNTKESTLADKMAALVQQNKDKRAPAEMLRRKYEIVKEIIASYAGIGASEVYLNELMRRSRAHTGSEAEIVELLFMDGFKLKDTISRQWPGTFKEHKVMVYW